ncbi:MULTISPECIES: hypothetical protein [unclassified Streptomyces]|uniref:hypothetical protein n=1 Tax=unclassified Streptomyces TaxID=2593676 RepID=UPI00371E296C
MAESNRDLAAVDLVPRPVLHGVQDDEPERGVFFFGKPITCPLDMESAPSHIRAYAAERQGQVEFRQLVMNLSLSPKSGEPIHNARMTVLTVPPDDREELLLRDASPLLLTRAVTRTATLTIKGGAGGVAGPEAQVGTQREDEDAFLVARGLDTTCVQWEFRHTSGQELDGSHLLKATVELPVGVTGSFHLSAAVSIRRKRLGIIPYRALLPRDRSVVPCR